jgi:hypothetical protein
MSTVQPAPARRFQRGDLVQTWFDTGAGKTGGARILYGQVVAAGPKAAHIVWESGLSNRVRQDALTIKTANDQEDARQAMEKASDAVAEASRAHRR